MTKIRMSAPYIYDVCSVTELEENVGEGRNCVKKDL
jgi:hypothetical protein